MTFFTRYFPPPSVDTENVGYSMTQQHYKDDCDLQTILARHQGSGELTPLQMREMLKMTQLNGGTVVRPPMFGDYSEIPDFASCRKTFIKAEQLFTQVPISVRSAFGNNPEVFYKMLSDPSKHQQIKDAGFGFLFADAEKSTQTETEESAQ